MTARLDVRGRAIEFHWWESPDARSPIVLLHEGLGSVAMWRDFPEALQSRTNRSVFAYSRLGHGASEPPPRAHTVEFMHEEAIEWLPAVLDSAAITRAVLYGHSDGASIALIFAATYPSRTEALILEAPHVFAEDVSITSILRMKEQYETTDLRHRLEKYHLNVDAAFHGWNDVWLNPMFRRWNLEPLLPNVAAPALILQGEQDEYGTLRQVEAIRRQAGGPVRTVILPQSGHSPHRDRLDDVLEAIAEFLSPAPA